MDEPGGPPIFTASTRVRELTRTDPGRLAIDDGEPLTYGELDERADRIARGLLARGGPGDRAAMRLMSLHDHLACNLAIARAGMISVAIDPTIPFERLQSIVEDTEPVVLLSDIDGDAAVATVVQRPVDVERDGEPVIDPAQESGDTVSILFTSGSTGTPKGIRLGPGTHDLLGRWSQGCISPGARAGVLTVGTIGQADELVYAALSLGATLVPFPIYELGLAPMAQWLVDARIELFYFVPTVLRIVLPTLPPDLVLHDLTRLVLVGEALTTDDVLATLAHLPRGAEIHDLYAVSECGSIATAKFDHDTPIEPGTTIPVAPLPGIEVRVVDEQGADVAQGEDGEVVVTGASVGLGYWRRPGLSGKTFHDLRDGRRQCFTGDGGRITREGLIELTGRIDHVIKVSGQRVDLGEIESVLRAVPGVEHVAATAFKDSQGEERIAAHVVPRAGSDLTPVALRGALARRLPGYMLPHRILFAASLPLLASGKVDRHALPSPSNETTLDREIAPVRDDLENVVATVWAQVLDLEDVGRDEDFFDLGGDSMRAAQMLIEIELHTGIDRPASLLLEAPTLAAFTDLLRSTPVDDGILVPIQTTGDRPPLIAIHGGGGGVFWARNLTDGLGLDQPIYGLQAPALTDQMTSFRVLCDRYVETASPIIGDAPAILYGFSFGAAVALEMAVTLQRSGRSVGLLAIGDLPLRWQEADEVRAQAAALRRADLKDLPPHRAAAGLVRLVIQDPGRVVRWARRRARQSAEWERLATAERQAHRARLSRLIADYVPSATFEGSVLLLRSDDHAHLGDMGWGDVVTGDVEIVELPCRHEEVTRAAQSGAVAKALTSGIDRVLSRR